LSGLDIYSPDAVNADGYVVEFLMEPGFGRRRVLGRGAMTNPQAVLGLAANLSWGRRKAETFSP
jgi:hypothetical protein